MHFWGICGNFFEPRHLLQTLAQGNGPIELAIGIDQLEGCCLQETLFDRVGDANQNDGCEQGRGDA